MFIYGCSVKETVFQSNINASSSDLQEDRGYRVITRLRAHTHTYLHTQALFYKHDDIGLKPSTLNFARHGKSVLFLMLSGEAVQFKIRGSFIFALGIEERRNLEEIFLQDS